MILTLVFLGELACECDRNPILPAFGYQSSLEDFQEDREVWDGEKTMVRAHADVVVHVGVDVVPVGVGVVDDVVDDVVALLVYYRELLSVQCDGDYASYVKRAWQLPNNKIIVIPNHIINCYY